MNSELSPIVAAITPALIALGAIMKSGKTIPNNYIPYILGAFGIALACGHVFLQNPSANMIEIIQTGVINGLVASAGAVYGHQLFKNRKPGDE